MSNASREEKVFSTLEVEKLMVNEFQKEGSITAVLRQKVTTRSYYPSKQASNSLSSNLFGNSEFGYSEQEFSSDENRVAFMNVPASVTLDEVKQRVANADGGRIYRIVSNHPILTEGQKYAIGRGLTTKDHIAEKQAVRYPKGHAMADELILDKNNKVQYRATFFTTSKEDEDRRNSVPEDMYLTSKLAAELGWVEEERVPETVQADTQGQVI